VEVGSMTTATTIPDGWQDRPTITVEQAAAVLGISRQCAYDSVRRGEIKVIKLGRRLVVPTIPLRRRLGELDEVAA
jgi:excisionase family DNA binding protein